MALERDENVSLVQTSGNRSSSTSIQNGKDASKKPAVSVRRVEANRKNSLKSTGPKTLRGKLHSCKNSLKHGFFTQKLFTEYLIQRENPEEFKKLLQRFWQELRPVGLQEELEVERIAYCWWRLFRVCRYENAVITFGSAWIGRYLQLVDFPSMMELGLRNLPFGDCLRDIYAVMSTNPVKERSAAEMKKAYTHANDIALDRGAIPEEQEMNKIQRYEAAVQKELTRAIDRLERLQRRRQGQQLLPPVNVHVTP